MLKVIPFVYPSSAGGGLADEKIVKTRKTRLKCEDQFGKVYEFMPDTR